MNHHLLLCSLLAVLTLSACGWRMPPDHPGPYARLENTLVTGAVKDRYYLFKVTKVDGRKLSPFYLHEPPDGLPSKGWVEEVIPAGRPVTIRIKGADQYEFLETTDSLWHFGVFSFGPELVHDTIDATQTPKRRTVEGDVTFTPAPKGHYTITGKLGFERSAVWIEDSATGRLMGRRVTN